MLTLEQLLQAKSHPEYFKLIYSDTHLNPSNENWLETLNTTCDNAFELTQIETMIVLKSIIQAFPMVKHAGLMVWDAEKNGYFQLKLFLQFEADTLQKNTFYDDNLDELSILYPKASSTVEALKQVLPRLVSMPCGAWWKSWTEQGISKHAPWNPKKDINKAYKEVMSDCKELVTGLERLSLSQILPHTSKVKSKKKL